MFAIAPTDAGWFEYLKSSPVPETVNFWTPTPWGVRGLGPEDRLYFLLKAPVRAVAGFGLFGAYAEFRVSEAWERFGPGNGVESLEHLMARVTGFAHRRSLVVPADDPVIGCILLHDPVFLDEEDYVVPELFGHSFPRQVVKLKYFREDDAMAEALGGPKAPAEFHLVDGAAGRRIASRKDRKGQSAFRQTVLRNYGHRCCVTSETLVELLEAAHIQPYVDPQSNHPQNGLCLRVDLHRLFDAGLVTIDTSSCLRVSSRLAGSEYTKLDGRRLRPPNDVRRGPSAVALEYHRRHVFR